MTHSRIILLIFIFLLLLSPVALAFSYNWIFLGKDWIGETQPSGDISAMYFYNDGVYAYFNETLVGAPDTSDFTYYVYLDKPIGGEYLADYRLIYSSSASKLQKRIASGWVDIDAVAVTTSTLPNSIAFKVKLSSIANPDIQQNTFVLYLNIRNWPCKESNSLVCGENNVDVGDVSFWADSTNFYVDIQVNPGWTIRETHLKVSKDRVSWSEPERWSYGHMFSQPVASDSYTIPLSRIGHGDLGNDAPFGATSDEPVFIMIHVDIENNGQDDETAYACRFEEWTICGDWASACICYEVIPELPWPIPIVFAPAVVFTIYTIRRRILNDK
jgi:hypothetical protein